MTYVFVDIDGTLAHWGSRLKKAGKEPSRKDKEAYSKWLRKIQNKESLSKDRQIGGMRDLIKGMGVLSPWVKPIYLTARNERYREVTEKWLDDNGFPQRLLKMRPEGNKQDTGDFKKRVIKQYVDNLYIDPYVIIIDDDPRGELQPICKEEGWTLLKAMSGGTHD